MKYLKMLGLAAVAAMALTAFLGAGSASATVLCKTTFTEGCAASGWSYPGHTTITSSLVGTATLTNTSTSTTFDTCTGGGVTAETENQGSSSETVRSTVIPAANITWTGCTATTNTLAGGRLEIHWITGTDNGTVTSKEGEVTVNIFGSCIYGTGAGTDLGTLVGSHETPILTIHAVVQRKNTCLGPAEAEWNATYHVTSPRGLFVAAS